MLAQTNLGEPMGDTGEQVTTRLQDVGLPAILCDAEGKILAVNSAAARFLCTDATPGRRLSELAAEGEDVDQFKERWRSNRRRSGWSYACQLRGQQESNLDLHLVVIPVLADASEGEVWLVIVHNLTETLIHARELEIYASELSQLYLRNKQHLGQLQEAQRSRDHFYSLVSHELKTPLTALKAALEMLNIPGLVTPTKKDVWRLINNMNRSTARLERIITDLVDLATARSGGISLYLTAVDMVAVIEAVVEEMATAIREKQLSLLGRWRRKRGIIVKGDEIRLQQVVQNLLSNAIKAAPINGSINISTALSSRHVRVSIANPGVSLDPSVKDHLFEPFRKSAAGGYKPGAGLGLSVVDSLVGAHNGTISVANSRRQVKFTFAIPLWREDTC